MPSGPEAFDMFSLDSSRLTSGTRKYTFDRPGTLRWGILGGALSSMSRSPRLHLFAKCLAKTLAFSFPVTCEDPSLSINIGISGHLLSPLTLLIDCHQFLSLMLPSVSFLQSLCSCACRAVESTLMLCCTPERYLSFSELSEGLRLQSFQSFFFQCNHLRTFWCPPGGVG